MPAEQQGQVYRTSRGFGVRWYDETGRRRRRAGFQSRSAARAWFRDVERVRMRGGLVDEALTLREFVDRYLERYGAIREDVTVRTLRWRLARPLDEFGDVALKDLRTGELAVWEASLPPRFRHAVVRALRQVLDAAVAWEYLARNPAKATGKNPAPPVLERTVLEPADVDRLAGEMRSPYDVAVIVGAWCYLRPAELLALERGDVDQSAGELHVRRTLDGAGGTKATGKTRRSLRAVPVPLRALQALDELPPRLDTRLLFPGPSGAPYDLRNFRRREFQWAVAAAALRFRRADVETWLDDRVKGVRRRAEVSRDAGELLTVLQVAEHFGLSPGDVVHRAETGNLPAVRSDSGGIAGDATPYTLRHSGISWALAARIPSSDVARFAGTSVTMLERVYHHLLETSTDAARQRLDAFSERLGQERAII